MGKAFEEWVNAGECLQDKDCRRVVCFKQGVAFKKRNKQFLRMGYRAALEWLWDKGYCVGTGHDHECAYQDLIEKELEN